MKTHDYLEAKQYVITCISPVYIGSGEVLKQWDYIYNKNKGIIYFLDKPQWIDLLSSRGLMEEFIEFVGRPGKLTSMNIPKWLTDRKISWEEIKSRASRVVAAPRSVMYDEKKKDTLNDLQKGITLADGRLYIPGSSVKGMLRTGILYKYLKEHPDLRRRLAADVKRALENVAKTQQQKERKRLKKDVKRALENVAKTLENEVNTLAYTGSGAAKSSLKGLLVSDAMPTEKASSVVAVRRDASTLKERNGEIQLGGMPICCECLAPDTEYSLTVTMDKRMMAEMGIGSLDEIMASAREYLRETVAIQQPVFGRDYSRQFKEAETADFILGGGTGFHHTSLWMFLFDDREEAMRLLRDYLEIACKKHHHRDLDREISPRTLKLVESGSGLQLMGLCSIREAD
ncbi:MAG: type III-A CRISPR-associated RAMP protein Csm5 [Selenomonadaceae bacterium]|nr:type III-A CRISPR-associated RAMP protein Csm5 [Selenomonadaceae bacterium]